MTSRYGWTQHTEAALSGAGWSAARREREMVQSWRRKLARPSGFRLSIAAERALEEFGGIQVSRSGPGQECARGAFVLDPMLADGEEERFAAFSGLVSESLFPLGEAYDGQAFLGIDEAGVVYLVGDALQRLGDDIYGALDAILEGRLPVRLTNGARQSP